MDFTHQRIALEKRFRPLQRWFDSLAGKLVSLAVLLIVLFVLFRILG